MVLEHLHGTVGILHDHPDFSVRNYHPHETEERFSGSVRGATQNGFFTYSGNFLSGQRVSLALSPCAVYYARINSLSHLSLQPGMPRSEGSDW